MTATTLSTTRTVHYQLSDPSEVERILAEELGATARLSSRPDTSSDFYWSLTHTIAGPVSVAAVESTGLTAQVESVDSLIVVTSERGYITHDNGTSVDRIGPGESTISSVPGETCRVDWTGELPRATAVRMDLGLLRDVAVASGGAEGAEVRFLSRRPLGVAAERHWQETVAHVARTLAGSPGRAPSPIVLGEACRFLAAMALATFPNTALPEYGGVLDEGECDGSAETLRRAVEFIEAEAGSDIGLADIARAACVTGRAVQLAFRRHLDTTPTAYLRSVRLARAHRELLEAAPESGLTVTDIALRWGFAGPGRFARYYRETFGVLPSETLAG